MTEFETLSTNGAGLSSLTTKLRATGAGLILFFGGVVGGLDGELKSLKFHRIRKIINVIHFFIPGTLFKFVEGKCF